MSPEIKPPSVADTINTGVAWTTSWVFRAGLALSTGSFILEGMQGHTPEMNRAGSVMYITGLGMLATEWIIHSPRFPFNDSIARVRSFLKSDS